MLPVALDGSGWVSSLSVALDVVGVCCVLLLHLCNLVLVLFGDGSFFLIGLGNTFFFLVWAQRPPWRRKCRGVTLSIVTNVLLNLFVLKFVIVFI